MHVLLLFAGYRVHILLLHVLAYSSQLITCCSGKKMSLRKISWPISRTTRPNIGLFTLILIHFPNLSPNGYNNLQFWNFEHFLKKIKMSTAIDNRVKRVKKLQWFYSQTQGEERNFTKYEHKPCLLLFPNKTINNNNNISVQC